MSGRADNNDVRELGRERESGEGSVRRVLGSKRLEANETARNEFFSISPSARRYSLDTSVGASIRVDSELNGRGGRYVNRGSDRLDHGLCGKSPVS